MISEIVTVPPKPGSLCFGGGRSGGSAFRLCRRENYGEQYSQHDPLTPSRTRSMCVGPRSSERGDTRPSRENVIVVPTRSVHGVTHENEASLARTKLQADMTTTSSLHPL